MVVGVPSPSQVRASEDEVMGILERRKEEEASPELVVSVYDVARNQKAFQQREEEEQAAKEEERLQKEKERDYLSPFLARLIGHSNRLGQDQMRDVTEVRGMGIHTLGIVATCTLLSRRM